MTDLKQAAQQAIEALDCVCDNESTCNVLHHGRAEYHAIGENCPAVKRLWVARRTLSEALAAPPQRQPLTDEQIDALSRTMVKGNKSVNWLCRAIEKAHGIGGDK
jgi:hypothetical protein